MSRPPVQGTLARLIRAVREERSLTQAELGALCKPERKQPQIAEFESGAQGVSEHALEAVAAALNISVVELLAEGARLLKRTK